MPDLKAYLADELDVARRRSLGLLDPLSDADQLAQHSPLMSPLVWDLAHVGHYEELWLLRALARTQPINPAHDHTYDAFRHARRERATLDILGPEQARAHIATVRGRALDVLDRVDLDRGDPLLAGGFVYGMVIQHEHQHDETMLATVGLMGSPYPLHLPPPPPGRPVAPEVFVAAGEFTMGTSDNPFAYDNERPAHRVHLEAFFIDTVPVTNGAYATFVTAGGYDDPRFWSEAGWAWRTEAGLAAPESWRPEGAGTFSLARFGVRSDVVADEPVEHVCWFEADAYARFAGKRLPTEAEWEKAAAGSDPAHANLGQRHAGPAPVGAYPQGRSACGAEQMLGDVWEWTASVFAPYPGFRSHPYREYSEVFYGPDYKVLRGGSWATHRQAARVTFRNWDYPVRRQVFTGFRCARSA